MYFLGLAGAAFLLGYLLLKSALKLFPRFKLMDKPTHYGHDRNPIPYSVGIMLSLGFFVLTVLALPITSHLSLILGALFILVLVSFIDDFYYLPAWFRLLVQIGVAIMVVSSGTMISYLTNPLGGTINFAQYIWYGFEVVSIVATILWIVFVTNMLNWLDGVPGLVSGVSTIAFGVIFLLASRTGFHTIDQTLVMYMSAILFGLTLACWLFDFSPPKLLMGDSGTMFLGACIAILSIVSGSKLATAFLVLGVAIVDGIWIILRRMYEKKSPLKGDLDHFHHKLLRLGYRPRTVLFFYYTVAALFGTIALWFSGIPKAIALGVVIISVLYAEYVVAKKSVTS